MQITLRKASVVQNEVRRLISDIRFNAETSVNEFTEDVEGTIARGAADFSSDYTRKLQLIDVLYEVRAKVGDLNVTSGINKLLADIAASDEKIRVITEVTRFKERKSPAELEARLQKMKTSQTSERASMYDRLHSVDTSVVTDATIRMAKASVKELKRRRQDMNDKLLQLNVNTLVELSEDAVTVLKEEGIL